MVSGRPQPRTEIAETKQVAGRHAYCLIVHDDRYCLETLLELIDDERNDIYILPDVKASPQLTEGLRCRHAGLHILPPEKRVDVRWGAPSLVKAELNLLEAAVKKGGYSYIHLMSGADLPLKSQDEIHEFFASAPAGSNFIEIFTEGEIAGSIKRRTSYYYPLLEHQRQLGRGLWPKARLYGAKAIRRGAVWLQKLAGFRRNWGGLKFAQGINWASLSEDFSRYLVARKEEILKKFRGVMILDEIYKQTMIVNSPFDSTVRAWSRGNSEGIRLMDWHRGDTAKGNPYVWRMADAEEIDAAFEPFARKFSSKVDREIIDHIRKRVTGKKKEEA